MIINVLDKYAINSDGIRIIEKLKKGTWGYNGGIKITYIDKQIVTVECDDKQDAVFEDITRRLKGKLD